MSNGNQKGVLPLAGVAFLVAWLFFLVLPGLFGTWQLRAGDQLFKLRRALRGNLRIDPAVVHLDVDDASIRALGASVETASRYEMIIRLLAKARVGAAVFDYIFLAASDGMVAATRDAGNVYYPVAIGDDRVPIPPGQLWHPSVARGSLPARRGVVFAPCQELGAAARGLGHITCFPDEDGVYRRFPLLTPVADGYLPSLPFRVACDYLQVPPARIEVRPGRAIILRGARFPDGREKDISLPVDAQLRILVNFPGYETESFAHYSLVKVLEIADDPDRFRELSDDLEDGIVIVADISAAKEVGPVPMERIFHLPGLHSSVINSILTTQFIAELDPRWALALDLVVVAVLSLIAWRVRSARGFVLAAAAVFIVFVAVYAGLFIYADLLANGVRTSLGIGLAIMALTVRKYVSEETRRTFLRARFESYFAPPVLEKILASRNVLDACEKKEITVLFSDIVGFTPWSKDRSPEHIRETLNEYFKKMAAIVFQYEGTVDKYLGDGLMAFFGDPIEHKDHARRAVLAARDMQRVARELGREWVAQGRMDLKVRIGVNSGEAVVGNLGSEECVNYTAIGATVNLAQRLESNAPHGGILISRAVFDRLDDAVPTRAAGRIKAKGFDVEIEVFEVPVD